MRSLVKSVVRGILPKSLYNSMAEFRAEQKLYTAGEARLWLLKWILPAAAWRKFTVYRRTISQGLQDYWVINKVFKGRRGGFFVDIGAADGMTINNSYLLEKRYQWKGICVEPNPVYFKNVSAIRNCRCLNVCVDNKAGTASFKFEGLFGSIQEGASSGEGVAQIRAMTLLEILEQNDAPKVIDYLSVDVEGYEDRVLCDFPFDRYTFLTVTIERPSDKLHEVLLSNGYRLACKVFCGDGTGDSWLDNFYVHQSLGENGPTREIYYCQELEKAIPYFDAIEARSPAAVR